MIRRSFTAVLERNTTFTADFATEPYETGWASEARWFVRVLDISGDDEVTLSLYPQISPDGLFWCDEGTKPLEIKEAGLYSYALRNFGHWLRLRGVFTGVNPTVKVLIYLALKE
jgi:hypothetical protein